MNILRSVVLVILALSLSPQSAAKPSAPVGGIAGHVVDSTGAAVPRARVVVINDSTHWRSTVETDSQGAFHVLRLPVGTYTVTAQVTGLAVSTRTGAVVAAGRTVDLNFVILVGPHSAANLFVRVQTRLGAPLSGAAIDLLAPTIGLAWHGVSDKKGEYLRRDLPTVAFTVTAYDPIGAHTSKHVRLKRGRTTTLKFVLP